MHADYMGLRIAKYKLETVEVSDSRVLRMQEILLAIKLVKFYVWEASFSKQVSEVRRIANGARMHAMEAAQIQGVP